MLPEVTEKLGATTFVELVDVVDLKEFIEFEDLGFYHLQVSFGSGPWDLVEPPEGQSIQERALKFWRLGSFHNSASRIREAQEEGVDDQGAVPTEIRNRQGRSELAVILVVGSDPLVEFWSSADREDDGGYVLDAGGDDAASETDEMDEEGTRLEEGRVKQHLVRRREAENC